MHGLRATRFLHRGCGGQRNAVKRIVATVEIDEGKNRIRVGWIRLGAPAMPIASADEAKHPLRSLLVVRSTVVFLLRPSAARHRRASAKQVGDVLVSGRDRR